MSMMQAYMDQIAQQRQQDALQGEQRREGLLNTVAGGLGQALAPVTSGASMLLPVGTNLATGLTGQIRQDPATLAVNSLMPAAGGIAGGVADAKAQQPPQQQYVTDPSNMMRQQPMATPLPTYKNQFPNLSLNPSYNLGTY